MNKDTIFIKTLMSCCHNTASFDVNTSGYDVMVGLEKQMMCILNKSLYSMHKSERIMTQEVMHFFKLFIKQPSLCTY